MQQIHRHDLLVLTPEGRKRIGRQIRSSAGKFGDRMAEMFETTRIPAIVRRHSCCDQGGIGVGISFPVHEDGQRLRFAAAVMPAEIEEVMTPYVLADQAVESSLPPLRALRKIRDLGLTQPGNLGVYGAVALQMVTRMRYVHDRSDLDLVIRRESIDTLRRFDRRLPALESENDIKIDVEVVLGDVGEVKLKELCSQQKTVLVKSITSVDIVNKCNAIGFLVSNREENIVT
jgi:malonate decarboxylase holo-[acyl-carrier-protein] synthase